MVVSGRSADNSLVEIIELADHPWFVGTQFHPEFKSRPTRPHPLFRDFVGACLKHARAVGLDATAKMVEPSHVEHEHTQMAKSLEGEQALTGGD